MRVEIKPLTVVDVAEFWNLAYSDPQAEWTMWNGPYFQDELPSRAAFIEKIAAEKFIGHPERQVIWVDGQMAGMVSYNFEDGVLQRWLDVGIVVYCSNDWHRGIGRQALTQWLDWLWTQTDLPHIGLTTWSGNERMCRLATRLGLKEEARVRQVRYWQGQYWDSVKFGCLREEWLTRNKV